MLPITPPSGPSLRRPPLTGGPHHKLVAVALAERHGRLLGAHNVGELWDRLQERFELLSKCCGCECDRDPAMPSASPSEVEEPQP